MPIGWYGVLCASCFQPLTDENTYEDRDGNKWDYCKECKEKEKRQQITNKERVRMGFLDNRRFFGERTKLVATANEALGYDAEYERFTVECPDILGASVVSSMLVNQPDMHMPVLDIDIEHYYFASSTPGHGHLYFNVPMTWKMYKKVLDVLAEAGIIEEGYARVSKRKGYSAVRLPWVKK